MFSEPKKDDVVEAWALDAHNLRLYKIPDQRKQAIGPAAP
jgi:hypothetical protein